MVIRRQPDSLSPLHFSLASMSLTITLIILALAAVTFVVSMRIAARPADPLKPRLINYNIVMIIAVFVAFIMIVHLINLAGIKTGRY